MSILCYRRITYVAALLGLVDQSVCLTDLVSEFKQLFGDYKDMHDDDNVHLGMVDDWKHLQTLSKESLQATKSVSSCVAFLLSACVVQTSTRTRRGRWQLTVRCVYLSA
eukprot:GHVR01052196.1.p2 GENE.GHVR01052196.1~~GHVR01052196.1.p2  ORF type:complete len:109 (-),score=6.46 GHVR01052196.1:137-463(-)